MLNLQCRLSLCVQPSKLAIRTSFSPTPSGRRSLHSSARRLQNDDVPSRRCVQSLYVDTTPPTAQQAAAAEAFFKTHLPVKSWTATEWRSQPHSDKAYLIPEVAFLGRSNSGKSSLLNGILSDNALCRVGPKPGKTTTLHAWALGPTDPQTRGARKGFRGDIEPKLTVLDMPGYGHGSHGEWGRDIMKYLTSRRQLRRAFVLVNPAHGLKAHDLQMLELLRGHGIPHQLIATKCDHESVKRLPELLEGLRETIASSFGRGKKGPVLAIINDILATGGLGDGKANKNVKVGNMHGLADVRWAIIRAAGLEEYAMSIRAAGGLLPKRKSVTSEADTAIENADTIPRHAPAPEGIAGMEESQFLGAEKAASAPRSPEIGIGIEELLAMTTPPIKTSTPRQVELRGVKSTATAQSSARRERMIGRGRIKPNRLRPRAAGIKRMS